MLHFTHALCDPWELVKQGCVCLMIGFLAVTSLDTLKGHASRKTRAVVIRRAQAGQ